MLNYLSKEDFEAIYKQILSEDTLSTSFLVSYLIHNKLVLAAYFGEYHYLGRGHVEETDPEMYLHIDIAKHSENPDLLNLEFHFRSDNIFRYEPYENRVERPSYEFEMRKKRRDNFRNDIEKSFTNRMESETQENKFFRVENTTYIIRKYTKDSSLRNDPTPSTCSINYTNIYQKAHQQLTEAIQKDDKNPTLRFRRGYNFFAYLDFSKKTFCEDYNVNNGIEDLDFVIASDDKNNLITLLMALELRAKLAYLDQDYLLAVRLLRKSNSLVFNNNKTTLLFGEEHFLKREFEVQYKQNLELLRDILSKANDKNQDAVLIEYHVIMSLNQEDYFPEWRKKIAALFKKIALHTDQLELFVECVRNDDAALDYQKNYILNEFCNYAFQYAKKATPTIQNIIYEKLLRIADKNMAEAIYLDEKQKVQAQHLHDSALSIYERIPLNTPAGAEAQIILADTYYYSALDQKYDEVKALAVAEPYHQGALSTWKYLGVDKSDNESKIHQRYIHYSTIIQERRAAAEELKKETAKKQNIFSRLFSKIINWFSKSKPISESASSTNKIVSMEPPNIVKTELSSSDCNISQQKIEGDETMSTIIAIAFNNDNNSTKQQSAPKSKPILHKNNRSCFPFNFSFNFFRTHSQKNENKNNVLQEDTQAVTVTPKP